ncbi:hypothetical protein [Hydrogenophaga sp.]|uniref:hypothetical protein n=1 Tax=Hydrogenophaga sp. TaxID=1904254 RepID=UPI002637D17E|nr:hypothetical protein [Hydrogenophaga sp.]MCW5654096.1 pilus assembly protein [Hydrogenophaga sp.]
MSRQTLDRQRGVALLVVMAVLLLASVSLLGGLQTGWLGERRAGSGSDAQRAFAAAEALVRDAELDILGLRADGQPCGRTAGIDSACRQAAGTGVYFPQDDDDLDILGPRLAGGYRQCLQGICMPASVDALDAKAWTEDLAAMTAGEGDRAIAATYGRYTGAKPGADGHPLLDPARSAAWYWVEVFRYADAAAILTPVADLPVPDRRHPFIYRIHAYVQGLKPGTRVHLRTVFVPRPQNQNP